METGLKNYTYTYNGFGQRVARNYTYSKLISPDQTVVSGELTASSKQYFYDHLGRLIAEEGSKTYRGEGTTAEKIVFLYDESSIIGMEYTVGSTTSTYYFHRNLLGDVIGIYDTSGTLVAKYLYDAWGNCTISGETTNTALAHANPIRYRGYYYDDDTGLYYLNARYYSPKWRRFISPDDTAYLNPESVNGLNLYCYCNNDPVNFVDPSGHSLVVTLLVAALVSGVVSAGANMLGQIIFDDKTLSTLEWERIAIAGVAGFCAGLIPGSGFAAIAGQAIVSSLVENSLSAICLGDEFSIGDVVADTLMSVGTGLAIKGISSYTTKLTSKVWHQAPNYSQYQHYFRSKGHNYSRQEVCVHMRNCIKYKGYADAIIGKLLDGSFSFLTYPTRFYKEALWVMYGSYRFPASLRTEVLLAQSFIVLLKNQTTIFRKLCFVWFV